VLGIPVHDCTSGYRCYHTAALRTLNLRAIRAQGYSFQVEMAYVFWQRGYRIREVPIIFVDRRVGKSKMSRKIFLEAFLWVLRTRLVGDPVVKERIIASAAPAAQREPESSGEASAEGAAESRRP